MLLFDDEGFEAGEYTVISREVFKALQAEFMSNPDFQRSIGKSFRYWHFRVEDPKEGK